MEPEQERTSEIQLKPYDTHTHEIVMPAHTEETRRQEGLELIRPRLEGQRGYVILEPDKTELADTEALYEEGIACSW